MLAWVDRLRGRLAAFRIVGEIRRLKCEPGDVLVLKCPQRLSFDQAEWLRKTLEGKFPGHMAIVLTDSMDLEVVSAPDEAKAAGDRAMEVVVNGVSSSARIREALQSATSRNSGLPRRP